MNFFGKIHRQGLMLGIFTQKIKMMTLKKMKMKKIWMIKKKKKICENI